MGMIAKMGHQGVTAAPGRMRLRAAATLLLVLGPAGGPLAAASGSAPATPPSLARGPVIPAERGGQLNALRCTSAADCWAVGQNGFGTQALHWNGRRWTRVATPGSHSGDGLFGLACTSPASCWAVGEHGAGMTSVNMALHWNGRKWSVVATPSPFTGQVGFNQLLAVTCISRDSCWAVGHDTLGGQALHWDGHQWSLAPTPGGTLSAVACPSSASCWAVGERIGNFAMHWDGHAWSAVPTPAPGTASQLLSVRCPAPASCWAVGEENFSQNEILHWNGRAWSLVATPRPRGTASHGRGLGAVTCTSPRNCLAVGPFFLSPGQLANEALHWNGHAWSYVPMPTPGASARLALNAVACTSPANCWAVGSDARGNQALHWNGHKWSTA